MIEQDKYARGDSWWMAIEYLANRTSDQRAVYFLGRMRIQIFVRNNISTHLRFKDDTLCDLIRKVLKAYLPIAKRERNNSKKAMEIYNALVELKKFVDSEV